MEITQVDKKRNMVKIHFKGYSEKFDEWRPCDENNLPVIRKGNGLDPWGKLPVYDVIEQPPSPISPHPRRPRGIEL